MTDISTQQIMSSRFRTSAAADEATKRLMDGLALSTKASVARLAIGRSLALGKLPDGDVDSKGLDIPATSLFTQTDVSVWVGFLVTHAQVHGSSDIVTLDAFRAAVRQHWHRGASLLAAEWEEAGENYDLFVSSLMKRHADLPDVGVTPTSSERVPTQHVPSQASDISEQLVRALADIGVGSEVRGVVHGPRVSRYKVLLRDVNQLDKLRKGIERLALTLNLQDMRPVLNHGDEPRTVSLDIPRERPTWAQSGRKELEAVWASTPRTDSALMLFPGLDVVGKPLSFDLAAAPHLLVGGATGQGKSVCMHVLITSLMSQHSSDVLKLALIDPKQVEFSVYENSKYLWDGSVAAGVTAARNAVDSLVVEMDTRYARLKDLGVNSAIEARKKGHAFPFIVAFIDELADLILQDRTIEGKLVRLAQLARASGIHLVIATQRPDAKTFSGLIRSNIPSRIALTVQKSSESTIILDETGAEDLLGKGDMLIKLSGEKTVRAHGYYLSLDDVRDLIK